MRIIDIISYIIILVLGILQFTNLYQLQKWHARSLAAIVAGFLLWTNYRKPVRGVVGPAISLILLAATFIQPIRNFLYAKIDANLLADRKDKFDRYLMDSSLMVALGVILARARF